MTRAALKAEAKARKCSQGVLLDKLIPEACQSPQALAAMEEYNQKEHINMVLAASRRRLAQRKPKKDNEK